MNLTGLDWGIVAVVVAFIFASVYTSRTFMRSVADYLSAGRTAGRYLISVSQSIAALGAITVIANFEMNYQAGFPMTWWGFTMGVVILFITVSGWVVYRFRETRAMTMAQFFEMRYSKNFRIFSGALGVAAGIINFGIFPAVEARFFIYFCGLPDTFSLFGLHLSTFACTVFLLLAISLYFVFAGGQVAIIISDFIQGAFVNITFVLIILYFFSLFSFDQIFAGLQNAPADASLLNPYKTSQAKDFNFWYFLIGVFGAIYSVLSWQGTQGFNSSARNAHEAKMAGVLSNWRGIPQVIFLLFIPVAAYTVMHHPDFFAQAAHVHNVLGTVKDSVIESQLTVPLVLTQLLPKGLMGAFVAVMLMASISTLESYMHSWGSIFVQDVVMPLRRTPLTPRQHINILRLSIACVALFVFAFSNIFRQTQYILLFFAVTGAIYAGGSGTVIIGGLYWKRGTTAAAWAAMITGSAVAVSGTVIPSILKAFPSTGERIPLLATLGAINGQVFWFLAMASAILIYILVSLFGPKREYDMDRLLHRGPYLVKEDAIAAAAEPVRGWKMLGMGKLFTRGDKIIYIATYVWTFIWFAAFVIGTIMALTSPISDRGWMRFWYLYLIVGVVISSVVVVWFTAGGLRDMRRMFTELHTRVRDHNDDGTVRHDADAR
ncbi:MAG TPA: sodium:solute symporter [bacterium]|nr:sodium:solute symporter [bacterium]HQG44820.1 sodium:solute symporter [bacterium]HQI47751.1 sodium:solute symporter [bacterium]HQJ63866.1 sodium:solute symporter [bacterium]